MKHSLAFLMFCLILLAGCGNGRRTVSEPAEAVVKISQQARTKQGCEYPEVMRSAEDAGDVVGLLEHLSGKYELESLHVFAFRPLTTGGVGKSIYATLTGGNVLTLECNSGESIKSDPVSVLIKTLTTIHTPSTRITVFDDTQGTFDNPEFNFPTLVQVGFSSEGTSSLIRLPGSPPYKTNLYLGDYSKQWPIDQRVSVRSDGHAGFQIFYNEARAQNISVLMIYAPSSDRN